MKSAILIKLNSIYIEIADFLMSICDRQYVYWKPKFAIMPTVTLYVIMTASDATGDEEVGIIITLYFSVLIHGAIPYQNVEHISDKYHIQN